MFWEKPFLYAHYALGLDITYIFCQMNIEKKLKGKDFQVIQLRTSENLGHIHHNWYFMQSSTTFTIPSPTDEIRHGTHRDLFHPSSLVTHKEDAANNFARGRYTVGKAMIGRVMENIRKQVEACSGLQVREIWLGIVLSFCYNFLAITNIQHYSLYSQALIL